MKMADSLPRRSSASLPLVRCGLPPRRYGVVIVAACTLGKIMTAPGQSPIIGCHIDAVMESLSMTRTTVTLLYLIATCSSSATLPLMGRLIDRIGPRISVALISSGLALACFLFSATETTAQLLLCFYLLRFFGQGSLMLVSQYTINLWWVRSRGMAMGVGGSIMSLGMLGVVAPWARAVVADAGWRHSYRAMGSALLLVMLPVGSWLYREKPETFGLLPDGRGHAVDGVESEIEMGGKAADARGGRDGGGPESAAGIGGGSDDAAEEATGESGAPEEDWTAREALRTGAFWSIAAGTSLIAATGTAYFFNLQAICDEAGLSEAVVSSAYPVYAASSVLARLLGGRAIDLFEPRFIMIISLAAHSIGLALMLALDAVGAPALFVSGFFMAVSNGLMSNTSGVAYAQFFGREHLGAIGGVGNSMVVLGSALGPFPFGLAKDTLGSFFSAFLVSALLPIAVALLVAAKGRRPVRGAGRRSGALAYRQVQPAKPSDAYAMFASAGAFDVETPGREREHDGVVVVSLAGGSPGLGHDFVHAHRANLAFEDDAPMHAPDVGEGDYGREFQTPKRDDAGK
jgi:MFS family permease